MFQNRTEIYTSTENECHNSVKYMLEKLRQGYLDIEW